MSKQTRYKSVPEMVASLSDDRDFSVQLSQRLADRELIKTLTILRTQENLTQSDVAKKLGCKQGKISKLESSRDEDACFGDLVKYTEAVGHEIRLFLVPKGQAAIDEVKTHAFMIERQLKKLVESAAGDPVMTEGVLCFLKEAAVNLVRLVEKSAAALGPLPEPPARTLQVVAFEEAEERRVLATA